MMSDFEIVERFLNIKKELENIGFSVELNEEYFVVRNEHMLGLGKISNMEKLYSYTRAIFDMKKREKIG